MTPLLEKEVSEPPKLGPTDQDALAAKLLEAIVDEARWEASFARSADGLSRLAEEVRAVGVEPMDVDRL